MKFNTYVVRFKDREVHTIHAGTPKEAKILAQAERIKAGKDFSGATVTLVGN